MSITLPFSIGVRGRYKVRVHDGKGNVKVETAFRNNLVTNAGFDCYFGIRSTAFLMAASPNSDPPSPGDSVLGDAYGYASVFVSTIQTASNVDPLSGPIYYTMTHTRTAVPGAFGTSSVNISKVGIVNTLSNNPSLAVLRSSPLLSAGLLVDNMGNPTTVSVLPTDYLDIVWEFTEFMAYDAQDVFDLDINGVIVPTTVTVRPANAFSSASGTDSWGVLATNFGSLSPTFNTRASLQGVTTASNGTQIGYLSEGLPAITALPVINDPSAVSMRRPTTNTPEAYVPGSAIQRVRLSWGPGAANASMPLNLLRICLGTGNSGVFSALISPPIPKTDTQQLELIVQISMSNV